MALDDMDRFIIKTALERAGNNLTAAARALGATRERYRYRVRKYNLKTVDWLSGNYSAANNRTQMTDSEQERMKINDLLGWRLA